MIKEKQLDEVAIRITELKKLKAVISIHDDLYYKENKPSISDFDYDGLVSKYNHEFSAIISTLDSMASSKGFSTEDTEYIVNGYTSRGSYTPASQVDVLHKLKHQVMYGELELRVGSDLTNQYEKMKHVIPMLSLSNSYSVVDVRNFIIATYKNLSASIPANNIGSFVIEDKADGVSCSLHYKNGTLTGALTRGDGETGEIITNKALKIINIPKKLNQFTGEVRGEIVISHSEFELLNNFGAKKTYKNQRNAVAGIIRAKSSDNDARLSFVAYDLISYDVNVNMQNISHFNNLRELSGAGFTVVNSKQLISYPDFVSEHGWMNLSSSLESIIDSIKTDNRNNGWYQIDGAVIKYDMRNQWSLMGTTAKFPKYATAYKYKDTVFTTIITGVTWQVGRTGKITPVAELEPVNIEGSTVSRATLHNIEHMRELGIKGDSIGTNVEIIKSASVIPKIIRVLGRNSIYDMMNEGEEVATLSYPKNCPCCGSKLSIVGPDLYCKNPQCRDMVIAQLEHYCARENMNIVGVSRGTLERLYDMGLVRRIEDLYSLHNQRDILYTSKGLGHQSVDKILNSIEHSKINDVSKFISGLGYDSVGNKVSNLLVEKFSSLDNMKSISKADVEELEGVGDSISSNIMEFVRDIPNILETLTNKFGISSSSNTTKVSNSDLKHKIIVLTGKFELETRRDIEIKIKSMSGKVSTTVSKKTSFLVLGTSPNVKKMRMAETYGVKMISEEDLVKGILKM